MLQNIKVKIKKKKKKLTLLDTDLFVKGEKCMTLLWPNVRT